MIIRGDFDRLGTPTRIIMTKFNYLTQMNCRIAFKNPSNVGALFSVLVKAYGGTLSATNPYGDRFLG